MADESSSSSFFTNLKTKLKSWWETLKVALKYLSIAVACILTLIGLYFLYVTHIRAVKKEDFTSAIKSYKEELNSLQDQIDAKEASLEESKEAINTIIENQEKQLEEIANEYTEKKSKIESKGEEELDIESFLREAGLEEEEETGVETR